MKVFITGCAGFAGSHLADWLLEQGQEVIGLVRSEDGSSNLDHLRSKIQIVRGDILERDVISPLMAKARPQRIYHLAALSSPADSFDDPWLTYRVNLTGTLNLLCAWRELQFDSRFLLVSSSHVYGPVDERDLPLREEMPLRPASPYAGSKAAAELLAWQFTQSYGLPIVRVRPFNHVGPRQDSRFVCSSLARQVAEIELGLRSSPVHVGNLQAGRDFTDVRDIVRGYHLALEKGQPGEVYQLCSGHCVSIETVLRHLTASVSEPVEVAVNESRLRSQDLRMLWGDPSKAAQALGWEPHYDLQTTLCDLKQYWLDTIPPRQHDVPVHGSSPGLANS
jgi:GDP-4-dehydro-6-deoxy-D-mannose reductase